MIKQSTIEKAIDLILEDEGGLTDTAGDRGGLTNYGITQATANDLGIGDVRKLTPDTARAAYRTLIARWGIAAIDDDQTFMLMADSCTNVGSLNAVRWLQRAIGLVDKQVDGDLGPKTAAALAAVTDWSHIFGSIIQQRIQYYAKVVMKLPDQLQFLLGWVNRTTEFLTPFPTWQTSKTTAH
jgi:lysozyme family protein